MRNTMKKLILQKKMLLLIAGLCICGLLQSLHGQGQGGELKWIRIGDLHDSISEQGTEVEGAGVVETGDNLYWPAAYGQNQTCSRAKAIWVGSRNYYDSVMDKTYTHKVACVGPRVDSERIYQIFQQNFRMIGKYEHPIVVVDDILASAIDLYDVLDETDENLPCDRVIEVEINTSLGVNIRKKIMAWSQQNHDDYFVYDYILTNNGIINAEGDSNKQDLKDFVFFHQFRYALVGEAKTSFNEGWGQWEATWGRNTVNQVVGTDPNEEDFKYRALYSWYGPHSGQGVDDWGCPNFQDDGRLSAARYAGVVVLHADKSTSDRSDDLRQPKTTMYLGSDDATVQVPYSSYDEAAMKDKYEVMTAGHAEKTHADEVGDGYANEWGTDKGGYTQTQGYGPYQLAKGDSIHIVFAEGVSGIDKAKCRSVGRNWVAWEDATGSKPTLIMPDGTETTDHNAYKREWVKTGEDSILQTFDYALSNYASGYDIPEPPPPPEEFRVQSGGDRILLTWANNAEMWPNFDGYMIYRSESTVLDPLTVYEKIFECDASDAVNEFEDLTATRGFDYYYYIQSKDDGSTNDMYTDVPLKSSMFWTLTCYPAYLRRPQGMLIEEVRVVPNPYDIRSRELQFGDKSQYDRIAFYELPGICKLKIFTERGDLIWEKDHTDGSGDELWDSFTRSGQIVVSGIYILYVEVTENIFAEEEIKARRDYYDPKYIARDFGITRTDTLVSESGSTEYKDRYGYRYTPGGKPIYKKDAVLYDAGDLIYRKGESVFRKFVVIR